MKKLRVIMAVMSMVLAALMAFTACGGSPETITFEAPVRFVRLSVGGTQFGSTDVDIVGEQRVTATISPANATNQEVDWTVNWKATNIASDIADYLEVIPDSDGSLTATVVCIQRFLYEAVVTVTSRADSTKKAEIICKCKSGYVIQVGNYVFAAEPEPMLFEESLNFRTYYKSYSTMSWVSVSRVGQLQYGDTAVYYQSGELPGWEREDYRAVYIDEDQDVSADFYTWFNANTVKAELSGKWQWNETLSDPRNIGNAGAPSVNFVSNGKEYDFYTFFYDKATDSQVQYWVDSSFDLVYENGVWKDEAYRILDFGETPQEVDGTFYVYFTANAVPYEEPETYTLSGKYEWKEDADFSKTFLQELEFESNGEKYTAMSIEYDDYYAYLHLRKEDGETWIRNIVMQDISGSADYYTAWTDEAYRIMDFGETPQEVDGTFYVYFTANAVPYEEPATYTIKAGEYKCVDSPTQPDEDMEVSLLFSTMSGTACNLMRVTVRQDIVYVPTSGDFVIKAYNTGIWDYESDKRISVTNDATGISESFYNWFTANYLPYEEPATYTIEAGTYQANEELGTTSNFNIDLNFTSNGQSFSDMNTSGITRAPEATFNYDSQSVYMIDTKTWINDNYRTIVIDTAQTVTDESFYNWFIANYLPYEEPETSLITVRYTENTVAGTVTITNQSDFAGYVEVSVSTLSFASIYITTAADTPEGYYKLEANQTRTLNVGGDWPEQQRGDDLIATVTPVLYVEPTLITFTISNDTYQAEEGMTWSEWVASSYNTGSNLFYKSGSTAYIKDMMYEWCVCYDSAKVVATDVIIAGAAYDLME